MERAELEDALDGGLACFVDLVGRVAAVTESGAAPVVGSRWSVAEVVAHVATVQRRGIDDPRRSASPDETAELNQLCLRELDVRDLRALAQTLERDGARVHAMLRSLPIDLEFPFHAGTRTSVMPASGVLLAEYLVHGHDIARTIGVTYEIAPSHARLALLALAALLPAWSRPTEPARLVVRLAETGDLVTFTFGRDGTRVAVGDNSAHPAPADRPVDVPTVAFLLAFPYGRTPLPAGCDTLAGRLASI